MTDLGSTIHVSLNQMLGKRDPQVQAKGLRKGSFALAELYQPLHRLRVVVREEQAVTQVEGAYGLHVFVAQVEVEHIEVLLHALAADGLGDYDDTALEEVTQGHLGGTLAMFCADACQGLVAEEVVAALGKGSPTT